MSNTAFKYNYALLSRIPDSFRDRSARRFTDRSGVNIDLARRQHDILVEVLRKIGVSVLELPEDEKYPDSVFIDDTAVVINGTALICKPADRSRVGEVSVVRTTLRRELNCKIVEIDKEQANLEGGDVLWTGKEIFVGLSNRTNEAGALAVAKAFPEYPTTMLRLPKDQLHLKSILGVAGTDILVCGTSPGVKSILKQISELATHQYSLVTLDGSEDGAAGVLYVNGSVLHQPHEEIPNSFPKLDSCFDMRAEVPISEFMKYKGTISSLVLLVNKTKNIKNFPTTLKITTT